MAAPPPGVPPFVPFGIPPLPPGWTEHQAPGGQPYYHHTATNQSTYTRPLPGVPFPAPGGMPFIPQDAVIPGAAPPKEKKKKERPLVKTPVPGTAWLRVKTTEGNVFWTHKERKESVWVVPEEVGELAEVMEREEKEREEREAVEKVQKEKEAREREEAEREREKEDVKRREREEVERVMEEVKDAVAAGKRKAAEPAEDDKLAGHKKARVEDEGEDHDVEWQRQMADEMAAEAQAQDDIQPAQQDDSPKTEADAPTSTIPPSGTATGKPVFTVPNRVDLSHDEAKALFKTLLHEKQINPLHPWDTSLPLFISDPRYVLLPSVSARREAFDEYCRDAARAVRQAKAATLKQESLAAEGEGKDTEKEAYERLLREEVTSTRTTWHEFRRRWKKERRFFAWAGDRERERLFREWVRGLADVKKKAAEKAEREFFQLLREHKEIKPGDVWKEAKRKIDPKDSRYDAVGSSSLREELFATYVKTVGETDKVSAKPADDDDYADDETRRKEDDAARRKERAERAARGLREREEKVRRERAGLERELGKTRGAVGREEGEREFMTLLTDAVRDPTAKWDTTAPLLAHDPRFVLCALPSPTQRTLFAQHVTRLREKHLAGLHALFKAHAPTLAVRWRTLEPGARGAVRRSAVAGKLGLAGEEEDGEDGEEEEGGGALEAEFEVWQRARTSDARRAFDDMLGENAFLEFWGRMGKAGGGGVDAELGLGEGRGEEGASASVPDEGEEDEEGEGGGGKADLKRLAKAVDGGEVGKVLKNDARWTAFDHVPEQRERWLRDYMERLAAPKLSVHVPDKDKA